MGFHWVFCHGFLSQFCENTQTTNSPAITKLQYGVSGLDQNHEQRVPKQQMLKFPTHQKLSHFLFPKTRRLGHYPNMCLLKMYSDKHQITSNKSILLEQN